MRVLYSISAHSWAVQIRHSPLLTSTLIGWVLLLCKLLCNTLSTVWLLYCLLYRKYKISNQFSIWDKMKQSGDLKSGQLINLAKYISHLIRFIYFLIFSYIFCQFINLSVCQFIFLHLSIYPRERSQSISVLRVVEFSEMTKPNVHLLRTILCEVLLMENQEELQNIFQVNISVHLFLPTVVPAGTACSPYCSTGCYTLFFIL